MLVEVKNLRKTFQEDFWKPKNLVLNNLSFSLEEKGVYGFLGANGAGKTTTLKHILHFIKPDSGEVRFGESLGSRWESARHHIGFLPEKASFYPFLTGLEFCLLMGKLSGLSSATIKREAIELAKKLNIEEALPRKIKNYSKGMIQRLGLLSALLHKPKLLILDEPLSGLDPVGRSEFKRIFKEVHQELGTTIFFSSHILSDVEEVCEHVIVIDKGSLVYSGKIEELLSKHQGPEVELTFSNRNNPLQKEVRKINRDQVHTEISEVIKNQGVIHSLIPVSSSLEEILYGERREI